MQGENESKVERDMKGLTDCVDHLLSNLTNNKIASEFYEASDLLNSTFSSVEHERLSMKETLKDLLRVEEEELLVLDDVRAETLGAGMTQQLSHLSQAKRKTGTLEEEVESLKNNIRHTEQLEKQLENRVKASNQHTLTALPEINALTQTYIKISRLKWDYTAPEDVVKGFVIHPQKKDVTPFKINKSSHSQIFIANFLWQQIGADNCFY